MQKLNTIMTGVLKKIVFYLILLLIWELVYRIMVDGLHIWRSYSFPSPVSVAQKFVEILTDHTLGIAVIASMKRIVVGYTLSAVIGLILGLIIAKFNYLGEQLGPLILGLQTLPSICWLPFAILWFGLGESAILFVITIGSTFAIAIAVDHGIKHVNPLTIRAAKTMGARGITLYREVIFPASLPHLVSGLKQGWSFAWRALMAGEMLSATQGLGQVLMLGRDLADISQVMAVMLTIIVLGLFVDSVIFGKIEKNLRSRWGLSEER